MRNALISTSLASAGSGVPARTIRRWWSAGRITGEIFDRTLYVNPRDVVAVMDTRGPGGRLPRRARMDLPDGITLDMPGGVMIARCTSCGETSQRELPRADGHDKIRTWAGAHVCGQPDHPSV